MACWVPACMRMPPGERAAIAELATLLDNTCMEYCRGESDTFHNLNANSIPVMGNQNIALETFSILKWRYGAVDTRTKIM